MSLSYKDILQFLDHPLDAIVIINSTGNIVFWNKNAVKLFGYSKKEVQGEKVSELIIPPLYRSLHEQGMFYYQLTGIGPILGKRFEVTALHKRGHEVPVELTVIPYSFNKGEEVFCAFLRDLTRLRKNESDLKESMARQEEFVSVCSHELKNPLMVMKLQLQMLERQIMKKRPIDIIHLQGAITKLLEHSDRMHKLVDDILDVQLIGQGRIFLDFQKLSLTQLATDICEDFKEIYSQKDVKLFTEIENDIFVTADSHRLKQVIINLLSNALIYGKARPVILKLFREKSKAMIHVIDKGNGIEPDKVEKIFEKYVRAEKNSSERSLGLGLYISRNIIRAHGGDLIVKETSEHGSTFELSLKHTF